jgi:hypothetical protein
VETQPSVSTSTAEASNSNAVWVRTMAPSMDPACPLASTYQ